MKAIEITQYGAPEVLRAGERPDPVAAAGEVLIRVTASGINRPDVLQRTGNYPVPPGASDIPGLEVAGTIAGGDAAAMAAAGFKVGDRVCALVAGGGYAEYCTAPAVQCLRLPAAVSPDEAAAIPETFFTVWTNLFDRAHLQSGERVLIHGGTSGIGTSAIQLARAFGATVFATAGSKEKCEACRRLGAAHAIDYRTEDFVQAVKEATHGEGVDVVLDVVGGDYLPRNLECLRLNGRLVQIGLIGGSRTSLDLRIILQKRLTVTGSTLRARTAEEKGAIARALESAVWPLLDRGDVRPIVHARFPLARAADAHRELESGRVIGKLILLP
jgi:NADPH2:quinone reductase